MPYRVKRRSSELLHITELFHKICLHTYLLCAYVFIVIIVVFGNLYFTR